MSSGFGGKRGNRKTFAGESVCGRRLELPSPPLLLGLNMLRKLQCSRPRLAGLATLTVSLLTFPAFCSSSQKDKTSDRPQLPYSMLGLQREELEAYESKGGPVADATGALLEVNKAGWDMIHRYFPGLGGNSAGAEKKVHPDDAMDGRFFASHANEDATFSPMPLLSILWSLPESELSGPLKALHDEVAAAMVLEHYSNWRLDELRKTVHDMTNSAKTANGVRYRAPKSNLDFKQAVRLYAVTIALVRMETKWADKADSPPPDMTDFTNRLSHQLPLEIRDGETATLFLYRPGIMNNPLSKAEVEERADVVAMTRKGATVEVQQFPAYLTTDQKEWNPSWIEPRDEVNDTTLIARKYEHDWTRLDGPYLWFRPDQLNGGIVYRATVKCQGNQIVIVAERNIASRGGVKREERPRDYDPARMTAFMPGTDTPARADDPLTVAPARLDEQMSWRRPTPYFSNGFRAWCAYGRWTSGLAADGKTWIAVPSDEPRNGGPNCGPPSCPPPP